MLDSLADEVSPHSYRSVINSMFDDNAVNGGRLYTLQCRTSAMISKYPWDKDCILIEYNRIVRRLPTGRRLRRRRRHRRLCHPMDAPLVDLPTYHRCYSTPSPPSGGLRFFSPPASPTPTFGQFYVYKRLTNVALCVVCFARWRCFRPPWLPLCLLDRFRLWCRRRW